MKKMLKTGAFLLLLLFLLVQLYRPALNIKQGQAGSAGFVQFYRPPLAVGNILANSCYDCHSNNTNYKWYQYIQPVQVFTQGHINSGKEVLNFNEWNNYPNRKQKRLLQSIKKQIESEKMPLNSYTLLHRNARLNKLQVKTLINWFENQISLN
ncbi:heme-binding domain-containing protein [Pedobacter sp. HDW13]|uniref:heme-binding domain-containing protein n=1 Tax=Pedobacter sp. HDW13 TaxID=2714940 RepID=UPI0014080569|nr:heme-binding domain-containing protein [Pedobacter sp. HDW13]QIL41828.1 heme-binding domain-containing protein [Pedobacter sp. HDW13]